jgi:hypothetical protein
MSDKYMYIPRGRQVFEDPSGLLQLCCVDESSPLRVLTFNSSTLRLSPLIFGQSPLAQRTVSISGWRSAVARISASGILERDGHLAVTVPETVETTAEDLAPALAAV